MKLPNWIRNSILIIYKTVKRFPATITFSIIFTALQIYNIEYSSTFTQDYSDILNRILFIVLLGVPLTLCIAVLLERMETQAIRIKIAAYTLGLFFLTGYYFFLMKDTSMIEMMRYILISVSLYLAAIVIPYFKKNGNYEVYVTKLMSRFFVSLLFAVVLFLGLIAILFTINKLFIPEMNGNWYLYIWITIAGIFSPIFFLSGIPEKNQEFENADYPKLLKILIVYIVLPLVSAYTVVLYVYFGKILILRNWPNGIISYLVLVYSSVGIFSIFLASPFKSINKWVKIFSFYFTKLIFPLLAMMFIAIGIRIKEYGFTENRYVIVVLGLWSLGIMLYLNLSKSKKNIIAVISLSLVAILMVVGPWDAFSVSQYSQSHRFYNLLSKNEMLSSGKIVKKPNLAENDKNSMSSIISYFSDKHDLGYLKYLPKGFTLNDMEKVFGFPYMYSYDPSGNDTVYFSYNNYDGVINDIKGYDYSLDIDNFSPDNSSGRNDLSGQWDNEIIKVSINNSDGNLSVSNKGENIYNFNLNKYVQKLYQKYGSFKNDKVDSKDMVFVDENSKVKVKFIFRYVNGSYTKGATEAKATSLNFKLLIGIK